MQNTSLTPISQIIEESLPSNVEFKPKADFYQNVKINKHRFAKIMKGLTDPTRTEIQSITSVFKIPVDKFFF